MAAPHRSATLVALALALGSCTAASDADPRRDVVAARSAGGSATAPNGRSTPGCLDPATGLDCALGPRLAQVQAYLDTRPGRTGLVLRDRLTGATWQVAADTPVWAASTTKLAMVVDLFTRQRAGVLTLTADDQNLIHLMLEASDDVAATRLWDRHGGADFATRFADYGMTDAHFVAGLPHRWGRMKCTPADLDRLINHVLDELPADERDYLVDELRTVAPNQQWGVWSAGSQAQPGNKNGWTLALDGHHAVSSVGFVGPEQRYTLAMMTDLGHDVGFAEGRRTLSEIATLLFTDLPM